MFTAGGPSENAERAVRKLASQGTLAEHMRTVSGAEYTWLRGGAVEIVWRVVFQRHTRRIEGARGHHMCASSVHRLEPDCHDRFQDDVEAVLDDLLRNATVPIANLEGWITRRIRPATVDAHRRRRGERGALQRPRLPLPRWLGDALDHDLWRQRLAVELLTWVGIPATAGVGVWPLDAWAQLRAEVTGDLTGTDLDVANDVEAVLTAMRRRPAWYANFVERPLGRKQAPVLPAQRTGPDAAEPAHLTLTPRHETDDARLADLAGAAVAAIEARIRQGEEIRKVVVDVLGTVFAAGSGAEDMDRTPGAGPGAGERVAALLADPATVDRIVAEVVEILRIR